MNYAWAFIIFLSLSFQTVAQDVTWFEGIPVVSTTNPENMNCNGAYELNHSLEYTYSLNTGSCCQWFYTYLCLEYTPGYIEFYATAPGEITAYYSSYYQPCSEDDYCTSGAMEVGQNYNLTNSTINGVPVYGVRVSLTDLNIGYVYFAYNGSGLGCSEGTFYFRNIRTYTCPDSHCEECLPVFTPKLNSTYIVNAWTKEDGASLNTINFTAPFLALQNLDAAGNVIPVNGYADVIPTGPIIDGWQRMEGRFTMDPGAAQFRVLFGTHSGPVYFDDIRIFPADGSMKSYVYDPENLRFVAELDERHFATFYEYDNEGRLVRVKKETERGIKTLKENRQNTHHAP